MAGIVGWAKKSRSQLEVILAACATRFVSLASNGYANPAQLASGTRTGAKFLRDDGTWQSTSAAALSATTVEADLGSTPVFRGKFTITDAAISATSKVLCWQAPGPYTGKGTRADEAEMQPVQVIAVEPASGSAVVKWQTPPLLSDGILSTIGGNAGISATVNINRDPQRMGKRGGRVRGNVKFSYAVFA